MGGRATLIMNRDEGVYLLSCMEQPVCHAIN